MRQIPYEYRNLPIPGGGYVTGFLYSEKEKDILYIRTDIGGAYRFDPAGQQWVSLIPHVTAEDLSETYPIALAIDEERPGSLFIACGIYRHSIGMLAISEDYGESFTYEEIPVMIHGNLNGRGTGERLLVRGDTIWFASQQEGLWRSLDRGKNWEKLTALPEDFLTFVGEVGGALLVGTAGVVTKKSPFMRGHGLYLSYDNGVTFEKMPVPENHTIEGCRFNGLVPQRWCADERYLYVTFSSTGRRSYVVENGYSCDSGDVIDGHIARYPLPDCGGKFGSMEEITPGRACAVVGTGQEKIQRGAILDYGFSGVSASRQTPGMLVVSTIVKDDGDSVFRSMDYGETWQQVLYDLKDGEISFRAPYMRPECNGGHSPIHWLSDIKINPFDDREAWFNTGTGVFRTRSLRDEICKFTDWSDGIEETVHLNVYSMPGGDVRVIDIVGDLGGFAFRELDRPCDNSFADAEDNRYITCINADFSDARPERIVVTARGNWTGRTKGGLILSRDQGASFERLPTPFGLTEDLDEALSRIEKPNVNPGWVAMSPDGQHIVWSVAEGIRLPLERLIVSHDGGRTFACATVYDKSGTVRVVGRIKVFSDRTDSSLFYGFGCKSAFYISHDCGQTYREYELPTEFPEVEFGLIDCDNQTEIRGEAGKSGVFYIAIGEEGLWKLVYDKDRDELSMRRLSAPGTAIYRVGLGIGSPGGDYCRDQKALYCNGIVEGKYGFYRSLDDGQSFERLNTDRQMFGQINSIDGDCREFGTFYLATGSNGLKYGKEVLTDD